MHTSHTTQCSTTKTNNAQGTPRVKTFQRYNGASCCTTTTFREVTSQLQRNSYT